MFCNDPVIRVYEGSMFGHMASDSVLNCCSGIAYHCTPGCRMILETRHDLISIGASGVQRQARVPIGQIAKPGEQIEAFGDGSPGTTSIDYAHTLFVGQRLLSVRQCGDSGYNLHFDDFCMRVVPHDQTDDISGFCPENHMWHRVHGCEKKITRKCSCGGEGELLLDFVSDYVVRCKSCGKSTRAELYAIRAIEDWNQGDTPCDCSGIGNL